MQFNAGYKGTLDDAKAEAKAAIDHKAGEVRQRYITVIPGQEATYSAKAAEIVDWDRSTDAEHTEARFPLIYASKRANGMSTATEARDLIASRRDIWTVLGAQIEEYREGGKREVDAASTVREAFEARDVAVAELDLV